MRKIYGIMSLYAEEMDKLEAKEAEFLLNRESYAAPWDEEEDDTRPYQVINGTALYDIKGKILSTSNIFTRIFGIPTYESIAEDFSQMAQDDEVDRVLLSMDTPGGSVSGISDMSDVWRRLNAEKPITVHTSGMLASAGIWLASNADKIYASETADVGSVGVIIQHVSYQEMLEKEGIKVTQIKSAPMKAIGSPAKDLTEEEEKYLQKKVDESDALFKKQLYTTRPGISPDAFTGETFSASESLRLGLIDGISTFSNVFEQLSASADSNNNSYTEVSMKRKVTAEMAEAAIASGADPKDLEVLSQEDYDAWKAAEEDPSATECTCEEGAEECTCGAKEASEGHEGEDSEELLAAQAQIEQLQTDLAQANEQVETLTAQVTDLEKSLEQRSSDPLRKIAEDRIYALRVALGMVKVDMSEFSTESILAEYKALDGQFNKWYKSGGSVKTKVADEEDAPKQKVTSIDQARYRSVM